MAREYQTQAKNDILKYFEEHENQKLHPAEICKGLNENGIVVNLTTVYRNLSRLVEAGTIVKVRDADSEGAAYTYSSGHCHCNSHLHAQCKGCGKMFHLESDAAKVFCEALLKDYGFVLNLRSSTLIGYCAECKEKMHA